MQTKRVNIPNISCQHCKMRIEKQVSALQGVAAATVTVPDRMFAVQWDENKTGWETIRGTLEKIGYPPVE